jgi:hypothetical protein
MKFINRGETIEGKRIAIKTRKQTLQTSVEIDNIGRCFKYLCQKNANASITEELDIKVSKFSEKSHLDINDSVSGDSIDLYSSDKLQFTKEANYSSKHGIQSSETKQYGCAQIRIPFRFALEMGHIDLID